MTKRMQKILLGFSLLLALPFVVGYGVYFGYCHSWWGKDNLLFRSLWLCSCPAGFEETLYPDYVEVVFSACNEVEVDAYTVPDNSIFLVTGDENTPDMPVYVWDPVTNAKTSFLNYRTSHMFLTKDWVIDSSGTESHMIDWRTGRRLPYQRLTINGELLPEYLVDGQPSPQLKDILYPSFGRLVFLRYDEDSSESDEPDSKEVYVYSLPKDESDPNQVAFYASDRAEIGIGLWIKKLLDNNQIPYEEIKERDGRISPNGKYWASLTNVVEIETGKVVLDYSDLQKAVQLNTCEPNTSIEDCRLYYLFFWQGDSQAIFMTLNEPSLHYRITSIDVGTPLGKSNLNGPYLRLPLPPTP